MNIHLKAPAILFFCFFFLFFFFGCVGSSFPCKGFSLAVASRGHSSSRRVGLSLSWPLLLRSTGSRRTGSVVVAHRPSCSVTCGIFPDQGSNPCRLHWQADSQPLCHQGSPPAILVSCTVMRLRHPDRDVSGSNMFKLWVNSLK